MLTKLFDTLGNMGIWIRLNDKRTEPPSEEGRVWGPAVSGFAISLAALTPETLSILIKNLSDTEKRAQLPPWLSCLELDFKDPRGAPVVQKPYAKQVFSDEKRRKPVERVFPAGKYLATDIPIGALYEMSASGAYRVQVTCPIPGNQSGARLTSNEITLNV